MDSMLSTAARALGAADPLVALKLVALRELFFCGGGSSGKVRAVKRPRRKKT